MEGKRSHDFLGRERLPNSRGHGVTLFQNAAWPSVAAAARILASLHAISSFSSPPLAALTGWGGERGGERSSSLFFLELSVDRPSTTAPRERGRTRSKKRVSRKKGTRESIFRAYSQSFKTLNCESISLPLLSTFQRDLSVRKEVSTTSIFLF